MNTILLSGAKNFSLPLLAATILSRNMYTFSNFAMNSDIAAQLDILSQFNVYYNVDNANNIISIDTTKLKIPKYLNFNRNVRSTYYFIGSLYTHNKTLNFNIDNGCNIDNRKINFHLDLLKKFNKPYSYSTNKKELFIYKQPKNIYKNKQMLLFMKLKNIIKYIQIMLF